MLLPPLAAAVVCSCLAHESREEEGVEGNLGIEIHLAPWGRQGAKSMLQEGEDQETARTGRGIVVNNLTAK